MFTLSVVSGIQLFGLVLLVLGQVVGARQGYRFSDLHLIAVVAVALVTLLSSAALLRRKRRAIQVAIGLQLLQVVAIATASFTFQFAMGPVARVQLWPDSIRTQFGAYGTFVLGFERLAEPALMVNFVPLVIVVALWRRLRPEQLPQASSDGAA